ncbi:RDD family protein [Microbacterium sp. NPDC055988]|uniref:RDD family protein n=1 Tax=Microbacterium sp. NPDC055988 TaxID=3345671 RepID=UPI0035D8E916
MKNLWWRRAGDFLLGTVAPWSLLSQILGTIFFRRSWPDGRAATLVAFAAFALIVAIGSTLSRNGQTPAQRLFGLRTLDLHGGEARRSQQAVRGACHLLDILSFGIGFLWPLWDRRAQTFADKVAATVVVSASEESHRERKSP